MSRDDRVKHRGRGRGGVPRGPTVGALKYHRGRAMASRKMKITDREGGRGKFFT